MRLYSTESARFTIPRPPVDRLSALVATIGDLSSLTPERFASVSAHCAALGRTVGNNQSWAGSEDIADLISVASYLACHLLINEAHEESDACRIAMKRAANRWAEQGGKRAMQSLDAVMDYSPEEEAMVERKEASIYRQGAIAPDTIATGTPADRRVEALVSLTDRQGEILQAAAHGQWQDGTPSVSAILTALGEPTHGKARVRARAEVSGALQAAREAYAYLLRAERTGHAGASSAVWAMDRLAKRAANPRVVKGHAQVGNRPIPSSGACSPVVLRCMLTGDLSILLPDTGTLVATTPEAGEWTLEARIGDVAAFTPTVPLPEDAAMLSARQIVSAAREARRRIAQAEEFIATVDPARERSTSRSSAIAGVTPGLIWGSTIAATGRPYRKVASSKRKRDGSIGSPMTRG